MLFNFEFCLLFVFIFITHAYRKEWGCTSVLKTQENMYKGICGSLFCLLYISFAWVHITLKIWTLVIFKGRQIFKLSVAFKVWMMKVMQCFIKLYNISHQVQEIYRKWVWILWWSFFFFFLKTFSFLLMQLNYGPAESLRKAIHNCFSTIKLYYTRGFDHKATYYGYNINICGKVFQMLYETNKTFTF